MLFSLFLKIIRTLRGKGLTRIPGILPLYRAVYRRAVPDGIISFECQGSTMFVDSSDEGLVPFLVKGVHEGPGTDLFQKLVKPGMVVLDIGANVGYYTLMAAKLMRGEGHVYAFEPAPANYELLVKNVEVNEYHNVTPINRAISNRRRKLELFLDKINFGGPSLSNKNMPIIAGSVEVETMTLDGFLEDEIGDFRVDFIKTDTQGAEGLIFEGAERTLRRNRPQIIMEFWPFGLRNMGTDPAELLRKIRDFGFTIRTIEDSGEITPCTRPQELIERCRNKAAGRGDLILLLQK